MTAAAAALVGLGATMLIGGPGRPGQADALVDAISEPTGVIDEISPLAPGSVEVRGWAVDLIDGESHPIIDIYVGGPAGIGTGRRYGAVHRYRPDVAAAHPGRDDRGFAIALTDLPPGNQQLCVYATGRVPSARRELGCQTVAVAAPASHDPVGTLDDVITLPERAVRARGWAYDPDEPTKPLTVVVQALQVNPEGSALLGVPLDPCVGSPSYCNTWAQQFLPDNDKESAASLARTDVGAAFPRAGSQHGFDHTVTRREYRPTPLPFDVARLLPEVPTRVCAWALNVGDGRDTLLGCRWVDLAPPSSPAIEATVYVPRLSEDALAPGAVAIEGSVKVAGDVPADLAALHLHVYVGGPFGKGVGTDMGPVTQTNGQGTFAYRLTGQTAGRHHICAYVVDTSRTRAALVSCWYATVG